MFLQIVPLSERMGVFIHLSLSVLVCSSVLALGHFRPVLEWPQQRPLPKVRKCPQTEGHEQSFREAKDIGVGH